MDFTELAAELDRILRPNDSYDIIRRSFALSGGKAAVFWCIDGLVDSDVMTRVLEFVHGTKEPAELLRSAPYTEVDGTPDPDAAAQKVLSGAVALASEAFDGFVVIYARR